MTKQDKARQSKARQDNARKIKTRDVTTRRPSKPAARPTRPAKPPTKCAQRIFDYVAAVTELHLALNSNATAHAAL